MKITIASKTICLAAFIAAAMTPALAQTLDASLDTNGDGVMSFPEMQAAFPDMTEDQFVAVDTSGDGVLDSVEISDAIASGVIAPSDG